MLSPYLVELDTSEMTDISLMLRLNYLGDNSASCAPVLVTFSLLCTNLSIFFLPHINCAVTLPQKISNMGIISNVTNLTR